VEVPAAGQKVCRLSGCSVAFRLSPAGPAESRSVSPQSSPHHAGAQRDSIAEARVGQRERHLPVFVRAGIALLGILLTGPSGFVVGAIGEGAKGSK